MKRTTKDLLLLLETHVLTNMLKKLSLQDVKKSLRNKILKKQAKKDTNVNDLYKMLPEPLDCCYCGAKK